MSDRIDIHLPETAEPLRDAIRRLRWFRQALDRQLDDLRAETGLSFAVDDRKLAQIFVNWLREVDAQKPKDASARRAYFDFVSGLMLRDLLREMPLQAGPLPPQADTTQPEYFWPEGFALTLFCLNVRAAVIEQEFNAETTLAPEFFSLRQWWTFKENVTQDSATAIGFFDVFAGNHPDWQMPDSFRHRLNAVLIEQAKAARLTE
ncbi:hypothetical protein [Paragemmobacter straminiformis]|uniref:Uncharacterized protein n=1 Tax=Paragemmobacter straminiformis TaxID=2045119 RepID=A0A842IDK6_9RHOB|nr:hypothetical protein [Gemmobacter straminiformis]MBC2837599.1 hypothetical protein [Gemmobacter straminiformis]